MALNNTDCAPSANKCIWNSSSPQVKALFRASECEGHDCFFKVTRGPPAKCWELVKTGPKVRRPITWKEYLHSPKEGRVYSEIVDNPDIVTELVSFHQNSCSLTYLTRLLGLNTSFIGPTCGIHYWRLIKRLYYAKYRHGIDKCTWSIMCDVLNRNMRMTSMYEDLLCSVWGSIHPSIPLQTRYKHKSITTPGEHYYFGTMQSGHVLVRHEDKITVIPPDATETDEPIRFERFQTQMFAVKMLGDVTQAHVDAKVTKMVDSLEVMTDEAFEKFIGSDDTPGMVRKLDLATTLVGNSAITLDEATKKFNDSAQNMQHMTGELNTRVEEVLRIFQQDLSDAIKQLGGQVNLDGHLYQITEAIRANIDKFTNNISDDFSGIAKQYAIGGFHWSNYILLLSEAACLYVAKPFMTHPYARKLWWFMVCIALTRWFGLDHMAIRLFNWIKRFVAEQFSEATVKWFWGLFGKNTTEEPFGLPSANQTQMMDGDDENEDGGKDEPKDFYEMVAKVVSGSILTIIGWVLMKEDPRKGMLTKFINTCDLTFKVNRSMENLPKLFEQVNGTVERAVETWAKDEVSDSGTLREQYEKCKKRFPIWCAEISDMYKYENQMALEHNEALREKVFRLRREADVYARIFNDPKWRSRVIRSDFSRMWKCIDELNRKAMMVKQCEPFRFDPYCVWIFGQPGIGKSFLTGTMVPELLYRVGESVSSVYARGEGDYWDLYHGQAALILDDAGQYKGELGQKRAQEFIGIKSNALYLPLQADIPDKGRPFRSKLVFCTSNDAMADVSTAIYTPLAYARRRNVVIEAILKKEFRQQDGSPDNEKIWRQKEKKDFNHLEFTFRDPLSSPAILFNGRKFSYSEMMTYVTGEWRKYYFRQKEIVLKQQQEIDTFIMKQQSEVGAVFGYPTFAEVKEWKLSLSPDTMELLTPPSDSDSSFDNLELHFGEERNEPQCYECGSEAATQTQPDDGRIRMTFEEWQAENARWEKEQAEQQRNDLPYGVNLFKLLVPTSASQQLRAHMSDLTYEGYWFIPRTWVELAFKTNQFGILIDEPHLVSEQNLAYYRSLSNHFVGTMGELMLLLKNRIKTPSPTFGSQEFLRRAEQCAKEQLPWWRTKIEEWKKKFPKLFDLLKWWREITMGLTMGITLLFMMRNTSAMDLTTAAGEYEWLNKVAFANLMHQTLDEYDAVLAQLAKEMGRDHLYPKDMILLLGKNDPTALQVWKRYMKKLKTDPNWWKAEGVHIVQMWKGGRIKVMQRVDYVDHDLDLTDDKHWDDFCERDLVRFAAGKPHLLSWRMEHIKHIDALKKMKKAGKDVTVHQFNENLKEAEKQAEKNMPEAYDHHSRPHKTSPIKNVRTLRGPRNTPQSCEDDNAVQMMTKFMHHCYTFSVPSMKNDGLRRVQCFATDGQNLILPHHVVDGVPEGALITLEPWDDVKSIVFRLEWEKIERLYPYDLAVIRGIRQLDPAPRFTRYMPSEDELYKYVKFSARMPTRRELGLYIVEGQAATMKAANRGGFHETETNIYSDVVGYYLDCDTVVGDCGAALFAMGKRFEAKLVGVHVAGAARKGGISHPITREMILDALGDAIIDTEENEAQMLELVERDGDRGMVGTGYRFFGECSSANARYPPTKTDIKKSKIHGLIKAPTTGPSVLRTNDPRNESGNNPMANGLTKYERRTRPFHPSVVSAVKEVILAKHESIFDEPLQVMTLNVAVNGLPEDGYKPLNMKSGAGYGWDRNRPTGVQGKLHLVEESPELIVMRDSFGNPTKFPEGTKLWTMKPQLEEAVWSVIKSWKLGKRPAHLWIHCLKVERRDLERIRTAKTRIFTEGQVHFQIAMRALTLHFSAQFYKNNSDPRFYSAVGIDTHSAKWAKLRAALMEKSDVGFDGDYGAYDGTLMSDLVLDAMDMIGIWQKELTIQRTNEKGEVLEEIHFDEAELRRAMYLIGIDVIFSNQLVFNKLHRKWQGNPSGNCLTVILNTIVGAMYLRIAFLELSQKHGEPMDPTDFDKYVKDWIYGDDNVVTSTAGIDSWFTPENISAFFSDHGIDYSMADKKARGTEHSLKPVGELRFLKRNWRPDPTYPHAIWDPIDTDTIYELTNWIREGPDDDAQMRENVEIALDEAVRHGYEFYRDFLTHVNLALRQVGEDVEPNVYDWKVRSWRAEVLGWPK